MTKRTSQHNLLISGMMRSGTTLLQRAINAHPQITASYQPKTSDFIEVKRAFLDSINTTAYHILYHYNPKMNYSFSQFNDWLDKEDISHNISHVFSEDQTNNKKYSGLKEVLVEEFYPYLIKNGVYCLNIIRDPRDVIASMSFGNGFEYTGKQRPVLFDLRNWRKSVHFAYSLKNAPEFKNILFEDLIKNTDITLKSLFSWLNVEQVLTKNIAANMNYSNWTGNSSFGDKKPFDPAPVNNYKKILPASVTNYIEAACWPEMAHLGYKPNIDRSSCETIITEYKDPFSITRPEFSSNYSSSHENIRYELGRLKQSFSDINKEVLA